MFGQGSPSSAPAQTTWKFGLGQLLSRRILVGLIVLCALSAIGFSAHGEEKKMRLRIAWGEGESRKWSGAIYLSAGEILELRRLGLEADGAASMYLENGEVRISQQSPRVFAGLDLLVQAPHDAMLTIELSPNGRQNATRTIKIPLAELIDGVHSEPLDDRKNRLLARRTPGDRLRVNIDRASLVFSPGEKFNLEIEPDFTGIKPGSYRCSLRMFQARTNNEVWSEQFAIKIDPDQTVKLLGPYKIDIPTSDGVYDLNISIEEPGQMNALRRVNPLLKRKPPVSLIERSVQFTTIGGGAVRIAPDEPWSKIFEIDPTSRSWIDRLTIIPSLKSIPGFSKEPLGVGKADPVKRNENTFIQLAANAWQAYPLEIEQVGKPHILEVEYPGDLKQLLLGISIVQPNAAGRVEPIGIDTGVYVEEAFGETQAINRHRLIFWPKTKDLWILLTNRSPHSVAMFGKIRILSGPSRLPEKEAIVLDGRLLAAYFDKPLFAENFSATEALDENANRSLQDWVTFYHGAKRLISYLKHTGYNAAVISVWNGGGTIYPSQLLEGSPKYDSGVFFASGQDPMKKDILEMLFRMFDREGLKLIPALEFSSPLPELEQLLRQQDGQRVGLELVDDRGRTWRERNRASRGLGPYYNPLDERVQLAMRRVVEELTQRYKNHASFAGVSLQLGTLTYAQLPGERWAYDDLTVERFERDKGLLIPGSAGNPFQNRKTFLQGDGKKLWLKWRAKQLARLHQQLLEELQRGRKSAKLYLSGAELFSGRGIQSGLMPKLPRKLDLDIANVMLNLGLEPRNYPKGSDIVLLRPQRVAPLTSLSERAVSMETDWAPEVDQHFGKAGEIGGLYFHEPMTMGLPSFDEVSPFGKKNTRLWLMTHTSPSGARNRRRFVHSIAAYDARVIMEGGWMLPLGQEEALQSILETYRSLPAKEFQTVKLSQRRQQTQPVVMRTLRQGKRTLFYLVNDSPWPVQAIIDFGSNPQLEVQSLDSRTPPQKIFRRGHPLWTVALEPYDLIAASVNEPNAKVESLTVELEGEALVELGQRIREVRRRLEILKPMNPPPPLEVILNPGFELAKADQRIPGWQYNSPPKTRVELDQQEHRGGRNSLLMSSQGAIVRTLSEPFTPPKTGRIHIWAFLKISDTDRQPPLRVSLQGVKKNGEPFYTYRNVGKSEDAGVQVYPIANDWGRGFLFPFEDIPVSELRELQIGFDLMGEGEVWIDDVQAFDLWFQDNEKVELTKKLATAIHQHSEGRVLDCVRTLEGYWPRFLLENVQEKNARVARAPLIPQKMSQDTSSLNPKKQSTWDRLRNAIPKYFKR